MRRVLGLTLAAAGLCLMVFPFVSVWRVTGQALDQLPPTSAVDIETDRNLTAMFSDDFTLATRSFDGISSLDFSEQLASAGYESFRTLDGALWTKTCCGEYDEVQVRVNELDDGRTEAIVSVFDNDIQASWPLLSGIGLLLVLIGITAATRTDQNDSVEGHGMSFRQSELV